MHGPPVVVGDSTHRVGDEVLVEQQRLGGVAGGGVVGLGVDDQLDGLACVGGLVDVHVAHALGMAQHRDARRRLRKEARATAGGGREVRLMPLHTVLALRAQQLWETGERVCPLPHLDALDELRRPAGDDEVDDVIQLQQAGHVSAARHQPDDVTGHAAACQGEDDNKRVVSRGTVNKGGVGRRGVWLFGLK